VGEGAGWNPTKCNPILTLLVWDHGLLAEITRKIQQLDLLGLWQVIE
jgi:hypothetical protein